MIEGPVHTTNKTGCPVGEHSPDCIPSRPAPFMETAASACFVVLLQSRWSRLQLWDRL